MSASSSFVVSNDIDDDRHHDNDNNNDNDESTPTIATATLLKQSIARAFTDLGHSAALPSSVLSSLAALIAATYSSASSGGTDAFDPTRLAEAWEAYALTHGVETLDEITFGPFRKMLIEKVFVGPSSSSSSSSQPKQTMKTKNNSIVISTTGLGKRTAPPGTSSVGGAGVTPSPAAKKGAFNNTTATTNNDDRLDHLTTSTSVHNSPTHTKSTSIGGGGISAKVVTAITPPPTTNNNNNKLTTIVSSQKRYVDRMNAGEVVTSYNNTNHHHPNSVDNDGDVTMSNNTTNKNGRGGVNINFLSSTTTATRSNDGTSSRHMYSPLESRALMLEQRICNMDHKLRSTYNILDEDEELLALLDGQQQQPHTTITTTTTTNDDEVVANGYATWTPVGLPKQNTVVCVGRICNEAHEGRLNRASIRLEGSRQHSLGSRIQLDMTKMCDNNSTNEGGGVGYSFFPGQIVGVEGINSSGRTMIVQRVIEGVIPPPLLLLDEVDDNMTKKTTETMTMEEDNTSNGNGNGGSDVDLSIWTACGPYTTADNLQYDPLLDLIERISSEKPDVVILCGPFVDGRQPLVIGENGHGPKVIIDEESGAQRVVTPEQLFATNVSELLSEMYEVDPTLSTQFVLVPSLDDAFVDSVYPQPPFQDNGSSSRDDILQLGSLGLREVEFAGRRGMNKVEIAKLGKRIHLASNPCTLHINDIVVGVTSTDILFQMSSEGCDDGLPPGSRLGRVAGHLVRQGSYYPLFPSAVGVPLDLTKNSEWEMPYRPDVLIVPSRLASFARPVGGDIVPGGVSTSTTVAVNPGELTKGLAGGTYARIDVRSKKGSASVDSEAVTVSGGGGVQDRVSVEIRRI